MTEPLTAYERRALEELYAWKHPSTTWRSRLADRVEGGIELIARRLPTGMIDELVERGLPVLNRVAAMTVPEGAVLAAYRRRGHARVRSVAGIAALDLEAVEGVVGTKRFGEVLKGGGERGLAGLYGGVGVVADVPALLGLALRSVNLFAYSYGFDPTTDDERAHVLAVLSASAALGTQAKQVSRGALEFGRRLAGKEAVQTLLERLPRRLLVRLAAMSSPKAAPIMGALTGAAFNAWFLQNVAVHARFAYRQRFIERRHGPEVLEAFGL